MSTNQSRQDELNALRERGVASNHRGKYSASSSFLSPEEAAAFLSEQRSKRKSIVVPTPPNNLSSADLNDWYSLQRQRDLEERKRREEAEAYLRGYRGFIETNPTVSNEQSTEPPIIVTSDAKSRVYSKVTTTTATVSDVLHAKDVCATVNSDDVDTNNQDICIGEIVANIDSKKESLLKDDQIQLPSKEDNSDTDIEITGSITTESRENDDKDQPKVSCPDLSKENMDIAEDSEETKEIIEGIDKEENLDVLNPPNDLNPEDETIEEVLTTEKQEEAVVKEENVNDLDPEDETVEEVLTTEKQEEVVVKEENLNDLNPPDDLDPEDETIEQVLTAEQEEEADVKEGIADDEIIDSGSDKSESIKEDIHMNDEHNFDDGIKEAKNDSSKTDIEEISDLVDSLVIEENSSVKKVDNIETKQWNGWISQDDDADFPPESGRYHIYLSAACPYSHAVLLVRKLKGLEDIIGVTSLYVSWKERSSDNNTEEKGWVFAGKEMNDNSLKDKPVTWGESDPLLGSLTLKDLYEAAKDKTGEYTIPVLWDKQNSTIVNNKTFDIIRMMNSEFNSMCKVPELDLYPKDNRMAIDAVNEWIYPNLNDGVFKCGSATTQERYDKAIDALTESFDRVKFILQRNRFLAGSSLSEADIRLFVTMLRFDEVYYVLFKTNTRSVTTCSPILNYLREIFQMEGVSETCNMDLIKTHYFTSYADPSQNYIIPKGDGFIDLLHLPHDRNEFKYLE